MISNLELNIKYQRFCRQIRKWKIFKNKLSLFRDQYSDHFLSLYIFGN